MGRFLRTKETTLDYEKQPLPLVGVYSNYNGNPDCSVYNSDFNLVSRMTQATNGYAWPTSGDIWTDHAGWCFTHSTIGGSSAGNYWVKATPCNSADGHQLIRLSPNGGLSARNPTAMGEAMACFGVVVGPEGYRQPMSLYSQGTTLRQQTRGGFLILDQCSIGTGQASWSDATNTNMRGAVGYHRETNTLVVIEARGASCNYRAHIWRHNFQKLSGKPGELKRFIDDAKSGANGSYQYIDFIWNADGAAVTDESRYRMRVIPTTSGKISLVRFSPNNCVHMAVLTAGSGNTGTVETNFLSVTCTTSYGYGNGNSVYYGMRHQISWDNKWVVAFAPYYYYGSGLSGIAVNTDDPGLYYRISFASGSCGMSLLPVRSGAFAFSRNDHNADSKGLSVGIIDLSAPESLVMASGVSLNAGDVLPLTFYGNWIDTGYSSTNYPCLLPVENWSR